MAFAEVAKMWHYPEAELPTLDPAGDVRAQMLVRPRDTAQVSAILRLCHSRGQTVVIIGESGCGKTVLLKLMIGLLRPTTGKVTFENSLKCLKPRGILASFGESSGDPPPVTARQLSLLTGLLRVRCRGGWLRVGPVESRPWLGGPRGAPGVGYRPRYSGWPPVQS